MDSQFLPLVSVVTPVYNGAEHLAECIESVLAQTYSNWDYTIVDNCSTDGSAEIAHAYGAKDSRIRVIQNRQFLRAVANHNVALRQISPESKYCKIVFGDDWMFPRCLEAMVAVAEEHPSVGIVGAYGLDGSNILWVGLPYPSRFVSGREACRRTFLQRTFQFGTANSVLYRSDLVRGRDHFFNESNFTADREACLVSLKTCDFGFVHQILTFTRERSESLCSMAVDMGINWGCELHNVITHGHNFLIDEEFEDYLNSLLSDYYNFLAVWIMRGRRDSKFWDLHKRKLAETVGFSRSRLAGAVLARLCRAVFNPYETFEKLQEERNRRKLSPTKRSEKTKDIPTTPRSKCGRRPDERVS